MALFFFPEFIVDLRNEGDSKFARRVLSKILDSSCNFPHSPDDHRYDGIQDAWIRYVSMGKSGIRVIYLRKGNDIYFYRAGPHTVEENLAAPKTSTTPIPVTSTSLVATASSTGTAALARSEEAGKDRFIQNYQPEFIRTALLSRRFIQHAAITLISPYLSTELFSPFSPFGKMLLDLKEEGTNVTLITRPPTSLEALAFFSKLERDGIDVLFHEKLHAKLFLFEEEAVAGKPAPKRLGFIGSANLTISGIGIGADTNAVNCANEELAYKLPEEQFEFALNYACYLTAAATDIPKEKIRLIRRKQV